MTRFIDITQPVDERMVCWPGRVPPEHSWERHISRGDHCNTSLWRMNAHSGTHMDAPLHFVEGGLPIDRVPPDVFIGECVVVDTRSTGQSTLDDVSACQHRGVKRLLLRTGHSDADGKGVYGHHQPLLTPAAASCLLEGGLLLIGTDRLSVDDSGGKTYDLHHLLLGAGCVILEGLLLAGVEPGQYTLYAAPLRLMGKEASPVRALLLER